ncbi:hypothetical protein GGX14DRAFT_403425 [Mycena pura]|uniref:Uncharacterized protein n=1 Tax=Mycena pura TaxID=153505 RepID=A0AAD6UVT5_9AGAR|nr:hypothetical protein GGX14DRAFT_403425 [Mycena pura]
MPKPVLRQALEANASRSYAIPNLIELLHILRAKDDLVVGRKVFNALHLHTDTRHAPTPTKRKAQRKKATHTDSTNNLRQRQSANHQNGEVGAHVERRVACVSGLPRFFPSATIKPPWAIVASAQTSGPATGTCGDGERMGAGTTFFPGLGAVFFAFDLGCGFGAALGYFAGLRGP